LRQAWRAARKITARGPRPVRSRRRRKEEFAAAKMVLRHRPRAAPAYIAAAFDWQEWQNLWGWGNDLSGCDPAQAAAFLAPHL
jgi:hypothetical protein